MRQSDGDPAYTERMDSSAAFGAEDHLDVAVQEAERALSAAGPRRHRPLPPGDDQPLRDAELEKHTTGAASPGA